MKKILFSNHFTQTDNILIRYEGFFTFYWRSSISFFGSATALNLYFLSGLYLSSALAKLLFSQTYYLILR